LFARGLRGAPTPGTSLGIIDSLQGIAYVDDRQVVEVHYYERRGRADEYSVRVSL